MFLLFLPVITHKSVGEKASAGNKKPKKQRSERERAEREDEREIGRKKREMCKRNLSRSN